jgi:tetratricopeptide (TPR) repeat protein
LEQAQLSRKSEVVAPARCARGRARILAHGVGAQRSARPTFKPGWRIRFWLAASLGLLAGPVWATPAATASEFATYVKQSFQEAQARYRAAPDRAEVAWQFGRACFDLAELATNKTQRAALAEEGIAACRQAIARQSNSAPAHYYLGMTLGQLAQSRGLSALGLVNQMERAFRRAGELDRHFDYAGADRNLGLLYRDAPPIISVGSRAQAREHLGQAVKLAPQYPENRLNLIEAYVNWGEHQTARRELAALEGIWPGARTNLTGVAWAGSWADWEPRLGRLRKKLEPAPKGLGAPREKN